ncbi:MAG: hypothetical protein GX573_16185 [Chloroflexi bacterium]|nr:hypothetical protein [Chloroflexota bacterium]
MTIFVQGKSLEGKSLEGKSLDTVPDCAQRLVQMLGTAHLREAYFCHEDSPKKNIVMSLLCLRMTNSVTG